jgi:hypothetical protein
MFQEDRTAAIPSLSLAAPIIGINLEQLSEPAEIIILVREHLPPSHASRLRVILTSRRRALRSFAMG